MRKTATLNGESNSFMFAARPMLEECTEHTTEPSPWANAGVTQVHGGSIIANTIRGEHIQANQDIRAPRITGGTITGNTINGTTVNGGTINGATVSGSVVKGSTIEGGVIKGTRIEGVTVEADNIIGDVAKMVSLSTPRGNTSIARPLISELTLPVSRRKRIVVLMPTLLNELSYEEGSYSGVTAIIEKNRQLVDFSYTPFNSKRPGVIVMGDFIINPGENCTIRLVVKPIGGAVSAMSEAKTFNLFITYA